MCVKVAYEVRVEREFLYGMVTAVYGCLGVPADISGAVRIVESVGLSDFESQAFEE